MAREFHRDLKNVARGREPYRSQRFHIGNLISTAADTPPKHLPLFLADNLFKLEKQSSWVALTFSDKDWRYLERLEGEHQQALLPHYVYLAIDNLRANRGEIQKVYDFDLQFTRTFLLEGVDAAGATLLKMPDHAAQSLYAFRLMGALNSGAGDAMLDFFRQNHISYWFKQRFLYPFVYYFLQRPTDGALDFHLSVAMPPGHNNRIERELIRFLLRDELAHKVPLGVKIYTGLICHPFDLCEFLLNHLEPKLALQQRLTDLEQLLLGELQSIVPSWRLPHLMKSGSSELPALQIPARIPIAATLDLPEREAAFIGDCLSLEPFDVEKHSELGHVLAVLNRVRALPYPLVPDYDHLVVVARGYHGSLLGSFLSTVLTSLYLLPRRDAQYEISAGLRIAQYSGAITAFAVTSPRGLYALEAGLFSKNGVTVSLFRYGGSVIPAPSTLKDRARIKCAHWPLMQLERDGRLVTWTDAIRASIPLIPTTQSYLTGIDWEWFDEALAKIRIPPLRGRPSAAFVLLLQLIEERRRDVTALRLVLESLAQIKGSVAALLDWLIAEFDEDAIGFVRFFLTADMILWLGLAPNYIAALTQRMDAMDRVAAKFQLASPLLDEPAWLNEQRAFNTALLMMNVGVNQFDVSWDALIRDAALRHADTFATYVAFSTELKDENVVSLSKQELRYSYASGQSETYTLIGKEFPLAHVIFGIIDTFMEHPSQGIESILSIRIRHNNFKREVRLALQDIVKSNMKDVPISDRTVIVPQLEPAVLDCAQDWLDIYMHQRRSGKDEAIFDFVPKTDDLRALLHKLGGATEFRQIAAEVIAWVRDRLVSQLSTARHELSVLKVKMAEAIDARVDELAASGWDIPSLIPIANATKAAVNHQLDQLQQWFACPDEQVELTATYGDVANAVAERFQAELKQRQLLLDSLGKGSDNAVGAEAVRLLFNLWCELIENTMTHSGVEAPRVRVLAISRGGWDGLLFSSTAELGLLRSEAIDGHPYLSATDILFREGNSGLRKVASLTASIAGCELSIEVVRRRRSFHVFVPIGGRPA